jgi:hypothetical protein
MSRNDDRNDEAQQAREHLFQGLGHLFRAAQAAATGIRKEIDKSNLGKSLDDAGRELFRAANNVVSRLGNEVIFSGPKDKPKEREPDEKDKPREDDDPPRWPPSKKPKGPTEEDPGFRIAGDDDDDSPR